MKLRLILCLLFSGYILAMDAEDASKPSESDSKRNDIASPSVHHLTPGLTVKEAKEFLLQQGKREQWRNRTVCCTSWIVAGISFTVGIAGSVMAGLYCADSGVDRACKKHCDLGYQGLGWCNTNGQCFISNDRCVATCSYYTPKPNDPKCISGAVMVAFPFICVGLAACSGLFNSLRNRLVDRFNQQVALKIDHRFLERDDNDVLTEDEMIFIGPALMASKPGLLKQLSEPQMLVLASVNLEVFRTLAEDSFADDVKITAQKLLRMLDMDNETLADTLCQENVRKLLQKNPAIFQALLHTVTNDALAHPEIRKGLKEILQGILGLSMARIESLDEALDQISQGTSINSYFPRDVVTDGQQIELIAEGQNFVFDKASLCKVSTKMKELCEDVEIDKPITLESTVKPAWVLMVKNLTQGSRPELSERNLLDILEAAHYFDIKKLVEECDSFLLQRGIHKSLITQWEKQNAKVQDSSTFQRKWKFCDRYGLVKNKHVLAKKLLKELVMISPTASDLKALHNLKLLNHAYIKDNDAVALFETFTAKFREPEFLGWVWANGKSGEVARGAVVKFCLDPHNKSIVESAFVAVPPDLEKALARENAN